MIFSGSETRPAFALHRMDLEVVSRRHPRRPGPQPVQSVLHALGCGYLFDVVVELPASAQSLLFRYNGGGNITAGG